jgi:hypothetical protein
MKIAITKETVACSSSGLGFICWTGTKNYAPGSGICSSKPPSLFLPEIMGRNGAFNADIGQPQFQIKLEAKTDFPSFLKFPSKFRVRFELNFWSIGFCHELDPHDERPAFDHQPLQR